MYVQGFVIAVPEGNKDAYLEIARKTGAKFAEYGASEIVEAWEDDVADGQQTDFRKAVNAKEGEKIVFSWMIWPDKATCEAAKAKIEHDKFWAEDFGELPFDGMRMIYGGFAPIFSIGRD